MTESRFEVADVFREYSAAYLDAYGEVATTQQRRVLRDLTRCRTAELGGHVEECDQCGHRQIAYNSCRNRHCPKCQATARAAWLERESSYLLETEYFHVVFTLPDAISPIALQNPRVVYSALFRAAAETLLHIAADPKHLGADIGFLCVLHTWGQSLHLHPHVHCVVPGGGISLDGTRWIACRPGFFLPVRVLSHMYRGKFLALLLKAFERGRLGFHGQQQGLADPTAFRHWIGALRQKKWVVYAKRPFGSGPEQVLKYLARYTHRVAISNQRLIAMEDGKVSFQWKDYADGNRPKTMELEAVEFVRRFLQHVVPSGFVRIRHYGFLANRHRDTKLLRCRELLTVATVPSGMLAPAEPNHPEPEPAVAMPEWQRCSSCRKGRMTWVEAIAPANAVAEPNGGELARATARTCDSS
jgi:hypothetical protein